MVYSLFFRIFALKICYLNSLIMNIRKALLLLSLLSTTAMGKAQTFYICDDGNVSTASEIQFSNNGTTINDTFSTTDIDSITTHVPDMHFVGGDMSMLTKYEKQKATYYTNTGTKINDLLAYVKEQGWNTIRVRLFVDPSNDNDKCVCQDIDYVKALGKRIKDAGLLLMLDFHYSDTWADPAKQWTPADWLSMSNDQLYTKIYEYTKDCLEQMNAAGASPDFIQTGNEISYGMMWGAKGSSANRCYMGSEANWPRFTTLLKQAGKACREVCPQAQIIIHIERVAQPNVIVNFYNQMKNKGVDYDIIGLSYYPYFHGNLNALETALNTVESTFDKPIQIVETGYPSKYAIGGSTFDYTSTYPYSQEGQRKFTEDLITLLKNHPRVNGLSWWYPEANAKGCTGDLNTNWYNAGLFNNENGRALKAFYEMKNFK